MFVRQSKFEDKKSSGKSSISVSKVNVSTKQDRKINHIENISQQSSNSMKLDKMGKKAEQSKNQQNITQLQATADNKNKVIQRNPFANAIRTGFTRAAPMIGKGVTYGSGALTIAGSASAMSGIYEKGKTRNPENPFDRETMFDLSREGITTGLGFVSGPFGKLGSALSMANNLYDANQARIEAQGKGASPLNKDTVEAFAKAELDKFRGIKDFGVLGQILDAGMGVEKIINNKSALESRFADVHNFMMQPREYTEYDRDIGSPFE